MANDSPDPLLDPSLACNLHSVTLASWTAAGLAWTLQTGKVLSRTATQINTISLWPRVWALMDMLLKLSHCRLWRWQSVLLFCQTPPGLSSVADKQTLAQVGSQSMFPLFQAEVKLFLDFISSLMCDYINHHYHPLLKLTLYFIFLTSFPGFNS